MATFEFTDLSNTKIVLDESSGETDDDILKVNFAAAFPAFDTLLFTTLGLDPNFASGGRIAGETNFMTVSFEGSLTDLSLTGWNSGTGTAVALTNYDPGVTDPTTGHLTTIVTTDGEQAVYLFGDYDGMAGALEGQVVFGVDAGGDLAFAAYMKVADADATDGEKELSFAIVTFQAIRDTLASSDDPDNTISFDNFIGISASEVSGFNFGDNPATNVLFQAAPAFSGGEVLLITGLYELNKLNSSKTDPTAFGWANQQADPGETLVATFVANWTGSFLLPDDLTNQQAKDINNIAYSALDNIDEATFKIAQDFGTMSVLIAAAAAGLGPAEDGGADFFSTELQNDVAVQIVSVTVDLAGGGSITFDRADANAITGLLTYTDFGRTITVDFTPSNWGATTPNEANGGVEVMGLLKDDFTTVGTGLNTFSRMYTTVTSRVDPDAGGGNKGDIGGFTTSDSNDTAQPLNIFQLDDAGPTLTLSANGNSLTGLELDETIGADLPGVGEDIDDRYADAAEAAAGDDNADDDEGGVLPAGAIGQVTSNETVGSLFNTTSTFDTDLNGAPTNAAGQSPSDTVQLVLIDGSGTPVTELATDLSVSDAAGAFTDDSIDLVLSGGKVYGMVDGETDTTVTANIAFIIELTSSDPATAYVKVTHNLPILHGNNALHDENLVLSITETDAYLGVQRDKTIVDGDDDSESKTAIADITNDISFDDDGPHQVVSASAVDVDTALGVNLDETIGTDRYNPLHTNGAPVTADDPDQQDNNGAFDDTVTDFNGLTPIGQLDTTAAGGIGSLFSLSGSYGSDGSGGALDYLFEFDFTEVGGNGIATNLTTTVNGETVVLFLEGGEIIGRETNATGDIALRIAILDPTDPTSQIRVQQFLAYDNGGTENPSVFDEQITLATLLGDEKVELKLTVTRTDFEGDTDADSASRDLITQSGSPFDFDDDGPLVDVEAVEADDPELADIALNLDESTNTDGDNLRDGADLYNAPPHTNGAPVTDDDPDQQDDNGDLDDVIIAGVTNETAATPSETPAANDAIGVLSTAAGEIADLFGVTASDFGTDEEGGTNPGDGRSDQLSLVLSSDPVETNLVVTALDIPELSGLTEAQRTIWLVSDATNPDTVVHGVIEGTTAGLGNDDNEYVAFTIEIENATDLENATLKTTHWLPIDHDGSEDPSVFDEELVMTLATGETLSLRLETTVTDGDGDVNSDADQVVIGDDAGSFLSFDDDGVVAAIRETGVTVLHDETTGVDTGSDDQALGSLPAAFAALALAAGATVQGWAQSDGGVVEVDTLLTGEGTPADPDDDVNDFGTDGPALTDATVFSLAIPTQGQPSNLTAIISDTTGETREVSLFAETWDGVDMIVGRYDDDDGTANQLNGVVFAVMIDGETGVLSTAQMLPIFNPVVGGVNIDQAIADDALQAVLTSTDGDGDFDTDAVNIGSAVIFRDDALSAGPGQVRNIEEDDIDNLQSVGLNEDDSVNAHTDQINLSPSITGGYDDPFTFSLKAADAAEKAATEAALAAANTGLTSQGETVLFDVNGGTNTVTLYVENTISNDGVLGLDDRIVGTWTVTAAGLATYTAIDQLDQATAEVRDESNSDDDDQEETVVITLTAALRVLDADGTEVDFSAEPDFIQYAVADDMPDIGDAGADDVAAGDEDKIAFAVIDFAEPGTAGEVSSATRNLEAVIGTDENVGGGGVRITSWDSEILYGTQPTPDLRLIAVPDDDTEANVKSVSYFRDVNNDGEIDGDDEVGGSLVEYFRLSIDDTDADSTNWTYTWQAFESPPPTEEPVDFNAIKSGGPQEILSPPVGGDGLVVDFDGLLFDATEFSQFIANDWSPDATAPIDPTQDQSHDGIDDRGLTDDADDGNPDAEGFGIKDGQASQFNHNEGFYAVLRDTNGTMSTADDTFVEMSSLSFAVEGIGKEGLEYHIDWQIIDDDAVVDTGTATRFTLGGNAEDPFDEIHLDDGSSFDAVYVRVWLSEGDANKGIRLLDFSIGLPQPVDDQSLDWTVEIADHDGDTDTATFSTGIDGTLDNDDDTVTIDGTDYFVL
ncbi:DUF5801 domain-containing protein [Limibaculum sp. FT325]|uniref:beta strand repeat-containing protein n=1 Tax=Thermohalobaculum sediminis TaxID=2939436 RepID=UPI0020BE9709|nr:DUF5801 repeats-in-toxin domain-containing protein [Limibaculum sediminis]MCL5775928.1 DUF5801 domain-containing protein [Limibaculum sediminis]